MNYNEPTRALPNGSAITTPPGEIKYRAHVVIEFTSPNLDPELEADEMVRDIVNIFGTAENVAVWLDDITEPERNETP
jgi:hypothetical protein